LLPAHALYVRHAKNLAVRNLEVRFENADTRPAIVLDDVSGAGFDRVNAQRGASVPAFVLRNVSDFLARDCAGVVDTKRATAENETL
jgi:hypothetical protein